MEPKYKAPNIFCGELAVVESREAGNAIILGKQFINTKGEEIMLPEGVEPSLQSVKIIFRTKMSYGLKQKVNENSEMLWPVFIKEAGNYENYGFVNAQGKVVIPCQYKIVRNFYYGRAIVQNHSEEKFRIIDLRGKYITDDSFSSAHDFRDGYSMVTHDGIKKFIDTTGAYLNLNEDVIIVNSFQNGYARVKVGQQGFNFINTEGKLISERCYRNVREFGQGFAAVLVDDLWGVIDGEGRMVIEPRFLKIFEFVEVY